MIRSIRLDRENGVERVTVMLKGMSVPNIFRLDGKNPRIVCDFPQTGYAGNKQTFSFAGELIQRVRVGLHRSPSMKTRLVIDLRSGVAYAVSHKVVDQAVVISVSPRQDATPATPVPLKTAQPKAPSDGQQATPPPMSEASERAPSPEIVSPEQVAADREVPAAPPGEQVQAAQPVPEAEKESPAPQPVREQAEEAPQPLAQDEVGPVMQEEEEGESGQQGASPEQDRAAPAVLGVSYESGSSDKEMVLFKLNGFHPPVIFSSEQGDLLVVCEFLDAVLGEGVPPLIEAGGRYVDAIRVTSQRDPDKVRVVLELDDAYNYDLKQVFFKEDNLFVVLIGSLGKKK